MNLRFYFVVLCLGILIYLVVTPTKISRLDSGVVQETEVLAVKENFNSEVLSKNNANENTQAAVGPALDTPENSGLSLRENFINLLNLVNKCLDVKNSVDSSLFEPKIENIIASVQNELGEPVIRSEDWLATEIQTPNGSRKLIKIETTYEDNDIVRKLKYYNISNEGMLLPIELTEEQSTEPTPTLIASLEAEGKVLKQEKSERIFFQNGEEIVFSETNGKISFLEMTKTGKIISCPDLNKTPCSCR